MVKGRNFRVNKSIMVDEKFHDFGTYVGSNLKLARKQRKRNGKKITQKFAADYANVTKAQIAHYEAGRRVPSLKVFAKLCELYGVSCSEMLGVSVPSGGSTAATLLQKESEHSDSEHLEEALS